MFFVDTRLPSKYISSILVVSVASMLFGMNMAVMPLYKSSFFKAAKESTLLPRLNVSADNGWYLLIGLPFIGGIFGCLCVSRGMTESRAVREIFSVYTIAFAAQIQTNFVVVFFISRFMVGMAAGMTCVCVPSYISKITPTQLKGRAEYFNQAFFALGILISQSLCFIFRDNLKIGYILNFIMLIVASVFYLCSNAILYMEFYPLADRTIPELLKVSNSKISLLTGLVFHLTQQLSGVTVMVIFSNTLFKSTKNQELFSVIFGIIAFLSTSLTFFVVDFCNRKKPLILSSSLQITGYLFNILNYHPIIGVYLMVAGYFIGIGPLTYIITDDIFPHDYKKAANSVMSSVSMLTAYTLVSLFQPVYDYLGFQIYAIPASVFLVFNFYSLFVFKDTTHLGGEFIEKEEK